jgi:Leucine-rich repeat (LRR) protein
MLTCFVAGTGSGCSNVRELRQLEQLGGPLELRQLENVTEADAKAAHLGNKKELTRLTLTWTSSLEKEEEEQGNTKVLEALKPHDGLKVLDVDGYRGGTYPTWINTLQQMVKLTLSGCKNLKELPPLWQLAALKVLSLVGLESLNCLCSGDAAVTPFKELKELSLHRMPNFETWWVNEVRGEELIFPQVEKLSISYCERLTALPKASMIKEPLPPCGVINTVWHSPFPALKELGLRNLPTFQRWEAVQGEEVTFPRLEKIVTWSCPELTSLPEAPNLSELAIQEGSQQMLVQVANCIVTASSLSKLVLWINDDREATWPDGNSLIQLVDGEEKQNQNKSPSPLTVMGLCGCNVFFSHSSALALWACLVQLEDLQIQACDALVHWPEEVFQSLESLRSLTIWDCNNLTGRRRASSEQSTPERSSVLLPRLESLYIRDCACLVEVPTSVLPASLKSLSIYDCPKLEAIAFSKQLDTTSAMLASAQGVAATHDEDGKSALIAGSCSDATASTPVPTLSSSTKHHLLPCLESLRIYRCDGLSEVLDLPPSIKTLEIYWCSNLQALSGQLDAVQKLSIEDCSLKSLESLLGELALLEELYLYGCKSLVSLPNGPQAYSSLRRLTIKSCPGVKLLPQSLQQRLGDLKDEDKRLDARYQGNLQFLYLSIKC